MTVIDAELNIPRVELEEEVRSSSKDRPKTV